MGETAVTQCTGPVLFCSRVSVQHISYCKTIAAVLFLSYFALLIGSTRVFLF